MREEIVLAKEELFCLSNIIQVACSDDETDQEIEFPDKMRSGVPCRVRELTWRSSELERAFIALDVYKGKLTASIPKNTHGRPPRPRLCSCNPPSSPIKPPPGLPVDCYSSDWLAKLSPRERGVLDIQASPILPRLIPFLNTL